MGPMRALIMSLCVLTVLSACGGAPPAQSGPAPAGPVGAIDAARTAAAAAAQAAAARTLADQSQTTAAVAKAVTSVVTPSTPAYEPKGRRDPFHNLEAEAKKAEQKGRVTVVTSRLTGIVRGGGTRTALVEAPDGVGYVLKIGDVLGDGRLLEITEDTAVFIMQPKPGSTQNRVVLKLTAD
jgi:Tfp pilus assembly protein PilP